MDPYAKLKNTQFFVESFNAWTFRHVTRAIIRMLSDHDCKKVLEVGCGTGKLLKALAKKGMDVTGVDLSGTMLDRAKKKKRATNLFLMDATAMPFTGEFDAAIIQIALHEMHPETRLAVFNNMKKAIKQNGMIILADFAETDNKSLGARISGYFFRKGEEYFRDVYPDHYKNYLQFLQCGGLKGFLKGEKIHSVDAFIGGNVELACVNK